MRAQVQLARPRKVFSSSFSSSASKSIIPERLTGGLSLTVPDTVQEWSLPAWQCCFPAELVNVTETDEHSTVIKGCSGMSRRKVHC